MRIGGVVGSPANHPPQVCLLGGQGGELTSQQLDLLLLGENEGWDGSWSLLPVRI